VKVRWFNEEPFGAPWSGVSKKGFPKGFFSGVEGGPKQPSPFFAGCQGFSEAVSLAAQKGKQNLAATDRLPLNSQRFGTEVGATLD